MQELTDPFLFSIIVPVYNAEAYLKETLDSISSQDITDQSQVEIVIVDDGSTDKSLEIAESFASEIFDRVQILRQQNSGVSVARNRAIQAARGSFVFFLDSDDKLAPNALSEIAAFLKSRGDDVDLISIPLTYFGRKEGPHQLNFKFRNRAEIIDIDIEPQKIQLAIGGTAIRKSALIENNIFFSPELKIAEDARLIQEVIMLRRAYGIVGTTEYFYRRPENGSSSLELGASDPATFIPVIRNAWQYLFNKYRDAEGRVPGYLQYVVAYEIQWRFKQAKSPLDTEQSEAYVAALAELTRDINDRVLLQQKHASAPYLLEAMNLKYGTDVVKNAHRIGGTYYFNETQLFTYSQKNVIATVRIIEVVDDVLHLEGIFPTIRFSDAEYGFVVNNKFVPATHFNSPRQSVTFFGKTLYDSNPFFVDLPLLQKTIRITPAVRLGGKSVIRGKFNFLGISAIAQINGAYTITNGYILSNASNRVIIVRPLTFSAVVKREVSFFIRATGRKKRYLDGFSMREILLHRFFGLRNKLHPKKNKIWLISDRADTAADNGAAFFKYVATHTPPNVRPVFLLSPDAPEYQKLSQYGEVVDPRSRYARHLHVIADKVISSQADDYVINPFGKDRRLLIGLFDFDYIFLQHGITKDDQSGWFNKFNKNIKVLVTAGFREWESIAHGDYGYRDGEVQLTGFPRFDLLENSPQKRLIVAPTWRRELRGEFNPITQKYSRNPHFQQSDYFKFWNSVITDERLNKVLSEYGYQGEFWLHPAHFSQVEDFCSTEHFKIAQPPHDYSRGFSEGSIFVTDFSSAVFDFAYLKKAVLYAQPDAKEFFSNHIYDKGYFSYQEDGFGPITTDLTSTVDALIQLIRSDGEMPEEYRSRVDEFFAFTDRNNCKRVVEAINQIDTDQN
ncbi:CDP-glycerol:glycerophosphate glycerophosphotransferase [Arcanobacterium canis]